MPTRALLALASAIVVLAGLLSPSAWAGTVGGGVNPQVAGTPALVPNDIVGHDPLYSGASAPSTTGGAIVSFNVHGGGAGAGTILASSSFGTGTTYSGGTFSGGGEIAVSPAGLIYYFNNADLVQITPGTTARAVVSSGSNAALGQVPTSITTLAWDYATGTILYYDLTGNASTAGFYRVNPATGLRTLAVLTADATKSAPEYATTDPFGNIFFITTTNTTGTTPSPEIEEIPISADGSTAYGTRKIISSNTVGAQNSDPYLAIQTLALDPSQTVALSNGLPVGEFLIVTDGGSGQATADIFRVPTATGDHTQVITFSGATANTGGAVFDLPVSATADTTGRIYYGELHNFATGSATNNNFLNVIPAGTRADTVLASAQSLGGTDSSLRPVPPPTPTLAAPTVSNLGSSTATLNGNTTADGGVVNSGIFQRGFVYSLTSANGAPTVGGTGVTRVVNFQGTALPAAQGTNLGAFSSAISSLSTGMQYSYSAFARNLSGYTYTAPATFTTISPPTANSQSVNVPFNTATAVTLTGSDPNTPAQTLTYNVTASPAHGTLSGTIPSLTYTPAAGYQGSDSFQFTTTNTSGLTSNTATVSITVAPGTPTANAQSVSTGSNTAKAITLTGSDPDSPALTLTYNVLTAPTHGTLSGTAPNLTYTPTANYQGNDSFTFRVSNGTNTSNPATVSITVAAGTPTANAQSVITNLNTAKAITLTGSDPDSPALTLTYAVAVAPANGTLSGTAPSLTYTPNTGFSGTDSFTFTTSNGQNTSAPATVSITVVGEPYITGFTASGPVGSTVTLTGNNLQGLTGVTFFRNVAATTFSAVSDTQITVTVPTGAKTGVISVTTPVGSNTTSTKFQVTP